ncbi:MAG: copper resistance protein CopC [Armatimonadetes bacterium]|nr:copper resistance protein CopC [Armatimonadota bacterium]
MSIKFGLRIPCYRPAAADRADGPRADALAIVLLAALLLGGSMSPRDAAAHARLVRAEPAPGSTVKSTPRVVRAWFSEELEAKRSAMGVWDARGRRVDDGKGGVDLNDLDRKSMMARLKPLGPGTYTVKWKAVSADDAYTAQGEFRFAVASP